MRNIRRQKVEQRKKVKQLVFFTLGILLFIYLSLSVVFGENGLLRYLKLKSTTAEFLAEVNAIKERNETGRKQIEDLKKNPGLIEELAREHGLTREGELIFKYDDE